MANRLRNLALQITIPVLCGLIALNAWIVFKNLNAIRKTAAQRLAASEAKAGISSIVLDLQEMEAGHRGYLITGDLSYLAPYDRAKENLSAHFAGLRARLADASSQDRSRVAQLESLAADNLAEIDETIRLRKQSYRHRAFLIVASNRGQQRIQQARAILDAMSSEQAAKLAAYQHDMTAGIRRAAIESALASCLLLVVTVAVFLSFNRYRRRLERSCATHAEQLRATRLQLDQFASTIFNDFRARLEQIRAYAGALLDVYGGFLPHQGQEKAEHIDEGAGQMISLLDDLSKNSAAPNSAQPWCPPAPAHPERLSVQ